MSSLHWPEDGGCANCATPLLGNWCHACGQRADGHHRSLRHLAAETIESLTHADGRLWHTLRLLVIRPARLTNEYLRGRRASEIPPLRLFFVTLLIVFATGSMSGAIKFHANPTDADKAKFEKSVDQIKIGNYPRLSAWVRHKIVLANDDPQALIAKMSDWSERFAILQLPLAALSLRVLFPLRRDVKLYDHLIFTMHSLSFAGMVWVVYALLTKVLAVPGSWSGLLFVLLPIHLYRHMRGVYHSGRVATLLRMVLLAVFTLVIFALLMSLLALVSLGLLGS